MFTTVTESSLTFSLGKSLQHLTNYSASPKVPQRNSTRSEAGADCINSTGMILCGGKNRPRLLLRINLNEDDMHHFLIWPHLHTLFHYFLAPVLSLKRTNVWICGLKLFTQHALSFAHWGILNWLRWLSLKWPKWSIRAEEPERPVCADQLNDDTCEAAGPQGNFNWACLPYK